MATTQEESRASRPAALDARSLCEAFQITAAQRGDAAAVRTPDGATELTYTQLRDEVERVARGLHRLGVRAGDTVGLMMVNRPEFHVVDLAAIHLGATPFSVYNTSSREQIEFLFGDAGNRIAVVERAFAERIPDGPDVVLVEELGELDPDPDLDYEAAWRAVGPEDLLTLIYTSGTTGPPKGVEITHANMLAELRGLDEFLGAMEPGRAVSFLPSAHIADRWASQNTAICTYGHTLTCCPDPREVMAVVREVHPTVFGAVPRVWEKTKAALEAGGVPQEAVKAALGLEQCDRFVIGAAPTPIEVLEYFAAAGILIQEVWGMSETSCVATMVPKDDPRFGTVGKPIPGVEVKLAADGELLVRGGIVMRGYRNQPERTAEALDADGWLHTGDVATIDDDGFVTIVDRKKELIINAAGKNMSPANIEAALKAAGPLIGQACVIGDRRPYNVALLVLDPEAGLDPRNPEVAARVQAEVDAANDRLSRVEQIKRFALLEEEWLPGGDELTPTMKLKRKPIAEKYAGWIEQLYDGAEARRPSQDAGAGCPAEVTS
jgi:long-subunit acyl-CoA synthetase (AMP-forming)